MKQYFLLLLLFGFFVSNQALGQQTTPKPDATPPADEDVVKISTNLVQVDVTVTDKSGQPIRDLRRDEIEVYQNGKKQNINNLSFVEGSSRSTKEMRDASDEKRPASVMPPTAVRAENVKRTIAVVVDDLNMSFQSVYFARKAIEKFVDEQMQEGDLIAIIRTGGGIGALQQFSNDKRQLYAAIDKIVWNPAGNGNVGAFAPIEAKRDMGDPDTQKAMEDAQKDAADFRTSVFATGTLGAVNYVVRGMAELPGRKSIMLVSEGFSLIRRDRNGFVETGRVMDTLRYLIDRANRSAVVIYAIDPRGLVDTSLSAADDVSGRSMEEINALQSDRSRQLSDSQDGLRYLSRETGGFAIYNSNDISWGIRKVLDDQSYYLVGYLPDDDTFDPKVGKYNNLQIKVLRKGARVRYRHGFFGVEDGVKTETAKTLPARMVNALTSPFAVNDVSLRLNALFGYDQKEGTFIRSLLHIDGKDIKVVDGKDGTKTVSFDVIAVVLGDNGALVDQLSKTFTLTLKKDAADRLAKSGFVYNFLFPMKRPGAYQLRVALHDHESDKIGSASQFIEVPNLKKKRLTLSGVALDNMSYDEYRNTVAGKSADAHSADPIGATAERIFKRGSVLTYGFTIYNARLKAGAPAQLSSQIRLIRDGKVIFEGRQIPIANPPSAANGFGVAASLNLGTSLEAGDYVMQIAVTDQLAKKKYRTATQFVQFEMVD